MRIIKEFFPSVDLLKVSLYGDLFVAENNTNIVSALNAGSGINIKELAQALVDAEKIPRESLVQSKIDKSTAKISGLGIVKCA